METKNMQIQTRRYTWLIIATSPHAIRLSAEIFNGNDVLEIVNFPEIVKTPLTSERAAAILKHQLNWIRTYTNAPIRLQTVDEFLVLCAFIPFVDLLYKYGIEVPGYTASEIIEIVKHRIAEDKNKFNGEDEKTLKRNYPLEDKSRQPIAVDHIFYDDVATVVFWTDGTKTVVKCAEGTKYDEYAAFCIALAKKIYGNNSALKRAIKNHARYSKKRQIEKKFNGAKDNFEKIETENKIEEAVRKYVEHIHKNLADAFQKEENKDA